MKQFVRGVKIIGTGSYVPEKIITNEYLATQVDTDPQWIFETLGIKERRIASENQPTSFLASRAALRAIENSGLSRDDIDLIIVATATPDRLAPSTACIVQDTLQIYNSVAFDIAAVCSGFLFAMSVASQYIACGVYDNVLVIGADTFSKIIDWHRRDCVFFGDGAGAVVMTHAEPQEGLLACRLYSDGRGKFNFTIPGGGSEYPASEKTLQQGLHYFQMIGREVYNTATKVLPKAILEVLSDADLAISDIDYMVPHQPSIKILKKTAEIIGLDESKLMTNMDKYANTSGATIPLLLDEISMAGRIKKGNIILIAAVGSGWTYGASIVKWVK